MSVKQLVFVLLILTFLTACSHVKSGNYVRLSKTESAEQIAKRYQIPVTALKNANNGSAFAAGEWIFIPSDFGVVSYFRKPAQDEAQQVSDNPEDDDVDRSHLGTSVDPQSTGFLWPVPASRRISSEYGARWGRQHEGIDIAAPIGSHILAIDDGVVMYSGQEIGGYGNLVVLAHRKGYFSIYAHALKNFVSKGQRVHRGQVVALVGMTGRSTGPHLHFEVRKNSEAYDPEEFVNAKKP